MRVAISILPIFCLILLRASLKDDAAKPVDGGRPLDYALFHPSVEILSSPLRPD